MGNFDLDQTINEYAPYNGDDKKVQVMKIYFSHGQESGPWGSKITRLAEIAQALGCAVKSIDYAGIPDPDQRVALLVELLQEETDEVLLVGSSMGGYVALVASEQLASKQLRGVFLLAPALYMPGYQVQTYQPPDTHLEVVHAWSDDIIPAEYSIRFAKEQDCTLHLIAGDHRLNSAMHVVEPLFKQFIISTTCGNKI